jgi:hypothetical protein
MLSLQGWAAGDVSLAAYIQASLAGNDHGHPGVSALGAVMAFLYSSYIVMYAVLGVLLGRVFDNDFTAHKNIISSLRRNARYVHRSIHRYSRLTNMIAFNSPSALLSSSSRLSSPKERSPSIPRLSATSSSKERLVMRATTPAMAIRSTRRKPSPRMENPWRLRRRPQHGRLVRGRTNSPSSPKRVLIFFYLIFI